MAIKDYTTEQLQGDLAAFGRMFPNGIPPEQYDRINAIKTELRRRGAEAIGRPSANEARPTSRAIEGMSDDELANELRALSNRIGADPNDDAAQERFADVRYEMRKRTNQPKKEPERIVPRQVETRAIELPPEEEQPKLVPGTPVTPSIAREDFQVGNIVAPNEVCGWTCQVGGKGLIFSHAARTEQSSIVQLNAAMSIENAEKFVAMVQAKIAQAKALS